MIVKHFLFLKYYSNSGNGCQIAFTNFAEAFNENLNSALSQNHSHLSFFLFNKTHYLLKEKGKKQDFFLSPTR